MRHFIFIILIIFVIILLVSLLFLLRAPISRGKIFPSLRFFVQYFCPPRDLFDLIVNDEIDTSKRGMAPTTKFRLKYIGPYAVGLLLDRFPPNLYHNKYDLILRLKFDFYKGNIFLFSKETSNEYSPFIGLRGNGFTLFHFNTPEDIPVDEDIICKVNVLQADEYLNHQYGPIKIYIQKRSEE